MLTLKNKGPDEELDYPVRWDEWLAGAALSQVPSDCTVTQVGVSEPGGLTDIVVDSIEVDSDDVVVWLNSGTPGETYTLEMTVKDNHSPQRVGVRLLSLLVVTK